jgi:hypothetical protein
VYDVLYNRIFWYSSVIRSVRPFLRPYTKTGVTTHPKRTILADMATDMPSNTMKLKDTRGSDRVVY